MAKGFKHGAGGADLLNFKVVGNPQPEVAKENTIWIDTDTPITGWIFSLTEPAQPQEGMVWITTGIFSSVEFNALKKNGIQVYPISAKQYISGAWVDKTAKSYQGSEWVDWIPVGTLFSAKFGGAIVDLHASNQANGSVSITSEKITLSYTANSGTIVSVCNSEAINLTKYSKFIVEGKFSGLPGGSWGGKIVARSTLPTAGQNYGTDGWISYKNLDKTNSVFELDISSVVGAAYVGIYGSAIGYITEMRLE